MRVYDGTTMLYNLSFDIKRMLNDNMPSKKVFEYIKQKMEFLENPVPGSKIKW